MMHDPCRANHTMLGHSLRSNSRMNSSTVMPNGAGSGNLEPRASFASARSAHSDTDGTHGYVMIANPPHINNPAYSVTTQETPLKHAMKTNLPIVFLQPTPFSKEAALLQHGD